MKSAETSSTGVEDEPRSRPRRRARQGRRAPRTTADPEETRERLRQAAIELLAEHGYEGVRVGAVARRAGLTTGAIYANYVGKTDLLADAIMRQHAPLFRQAVKPRAGDRTLASALLRALTREAPAEHRSVLDVMAAASRDEDVRDALLPQIAARHDAIQQLIEKGQRNGQLDPALDAQALAHLINLMGLGGAISQALGLPTPSTDAIAAVLDRMAEAMAPVEDPGSAAE